VANFTQAIMDLGATVCVRSRPLCGACPVSEGCIARAEGRQATLPTARPKKTRPQRSAYAVIAMSPAGAVLLERRPPAGLWGGLWTFPQFDDHQSASAWIEKCRGRTEADATALARHTGPESRPAASRQLAPYHHAFTHFDLTLHPLLIHVAANPDFVAETDRHAWYDPQQPARIGLAKPAVDLIGMIAGT
jgi:A/G-specific adenine glycosylase